MAGVSVDLSKVVRDLDKLKGSIVNLTGFFKNVADLELADTKLRFRDQKDPSGRNWDDPFTIRRGSGQETGSGDRTKKSGWSQRDAWSYVVASRYNATPPGWRFFNKTSGDKILRDTGTLMASIGRAYGPDYAIVGTNLEYAKKHQDGDGVKKREFIGVSSKTMSNVEQAMEAYLKGILK